MLLSVLSLFFIYIYIYIYTVIHLDYLLRRIFFLLRHIFIPFLHLTYTFIINNKNIAQPLWALSTAMVL